MKIKLVLSILTLSCVSLFGSVEKSIIPHLDQLIIKDLNGKINKTQNDEIDSLSGPCCLNQPSADPGKKTRFPTPISIQ